MKIPKQCKLENVVSYDSTRPAIENILICREKTETLAIATNGRSMAIVPVEIEGDEELGLLDPDMLIQARKLAGKKEVESTVVLNGDMRLLSGASFPRPLETDKGAYPRWQAVQPYKPVTFTVSLDPKLLLDLAEALGRDGKNVHGVVLQFSANDEPIRVTLNGEGNKARGVLMPMRVK